MAARRTHKIQEDIEAAWLKAEWAPYLAKLHADHKSEMQVA